VENAVTFLVTRFMPLNPKDLEGWMMNPEEWVNTEDKDDEQWQFEIRVSLKPPPIRTSLSESIAMCGASSHDLCEPISRVCFPTTCEGIHQCQWYEAVSHGDIKLFADQLLKSDHLPVCKISYKRRQYTAQWAGVLTV
jgi:hypothetical protein